MKSSSHVPALDGVRGVAILLVLAYNCIAGFYHPSAESSWFFIALVNLAHTGWIGVTLFFVLSGYLIGGILLDNREARNYYRTFFIRRTCRIVPLYFVLISPLFLVPWLGLNHRLPALAEYATSGPIASGWYPFFLQNFALAWEGSWGSRWLDTTWSLAVEEQFYVFSALLVRMVRTDKLGSVLVGLILFSPLLRWLLADLLPPLQAGIACYVLLPCRWDALALGMLIAWFQRRSGPAFAPGLRALLPSWSVACLIGLCVVFLLLEQNPMSRMISVAGHSFVALTCAAVLCDVLSGQAFLKIPLETRALGFLGMISYALYLFHEPVLSLVTRVLFGTREITSWTSAGITVLALALTILLSTASWFWFERRFVRFGHRFTYS